MSNTNLRSSLIRLASENPSLRPHLLPLLKEGAFDGENAGFGWKVGDRVYGGRLKMTYYGTVVHPDAGWLRREQQAGPGEVLVRWDGFQNPSAVKANMLIPATGHQASSSSKVIEEAVGAAEAYIDLVGEVMDKLDVIQGYAKMISRVDMQSYTGAQVSAEIWSAPLEAKKALQKGVANATRLTTSLLAR